MISYCRFITIFLFVFSFNSFAVESNVCANGGDEFATFQYAGFLTDENQNTVSGFQTVELQVSLFDSLEAGQEHYSQFFPNVEVSDGVFQIEVGPCIPAIAGNSYLQLHVNNQALSPRSKVLASALSIQALDSQRFSGLTTADFFFEINNSIQEGISTFTQSSIDPEFSSLIQNIETHKALVNNPHSVTKDQIGLSAVDNIQQLPFTHLQLVLVPTSNVNVPSSKAVADYIASLLGPINSSNTVLESRVSDIETSTINQVLSLESRVSSIEASSTVDLPMSYLQTVLVTDSNVNVPTSSAVATYIDQQVYYMDAIPADQLDSVQVANLMSGTLADGSSPWTNIPADQFTSGEVSNLQAGGLADGSTPWTANVLPSGSSSEYLRGDKSLAEIPADQFSGGEVSNLQAGLLASGASPWETSEADLGVATSGEVLAGDRSWIQLNAAAVDLDQVQNINVLESFTQNGSAGIETSKIRANGSGGLALINQSNQGLFIDNNGYVGVNTNTPTVDLQVAGTAKIVELVSNKLTSKSLSLLNTSVSPLIVSTNSNENPSLFIQDSGRIGINTTSPVFTLDVDGDINMSGDLYIDGIVFEQVVNSGINQGTALVGGQANSSVATNGIVLGGVDNHVYGENSTVSGGQSNFVPGHYSSISGGVLNTAAGIASGILAGSDNETYGLASAVVGGEFNISVGNDAVVAGGSDNTAIGEYSFIGGGVYNTVNATNSVIVGGNYMTINGDNVFGFNGSQYSVTVTSELTNAAIFFVDKFGIGNADPTETLDVEGRLRLRPSTDAFAHDGTLRWSGSDLELMQSGSWGPIGGGYAGIVEDIEGLKVGVSGATDFIVNSSGFVGVNTTAPDDNFHVVGNSLFEGDIEAKKIFVVSDGYADIDLSSSMGSALRMNVNTAGTVSSGIEFNRFDSPDGSIRYNYSDGAGDSNLLFEVENVPKLAIRTDVIELMNGTGIRFSDGSMQFTGVHPDLIENGSGSTKVFTHDNGIDFNVSSSTQIRITSTGNLGLGEYNPMERLVVDGRIQLKSTTDPMGSNGVIRYDGNDLEVSLNGKWMSMTGQESSSNVTSDSLTTLNAYPLEVYDAGAVLVQNDIFVFGGSNDNINNIDAVYRYNLDSQTWTQMQSMPVAKFGMAYTRVNNDIYVIGGEDPSGYTSSVFKYDTGSDTWTTVSSALNYPLEVGGANAFEMGNKVYVVGGAGSQSGITGAMYSLDLSNPVTWVAEPSMEPRDYAALSVLDSKVYVFGGEDANGATNDMQVYNGSSWETRPSDLFYPYETAMSVVIGQEVFIVGGFTDDGPSDSIIRYIPESNKYDTLSLLLSEPIGSMFAVSDGQQAFFGSGNVEGARDLFYRLEVRPFSEASGVDAFVGEGSDNSAEDTNAAVVAGNNNIVSGPDSIVGAGSFNEIDSNNGFIGGGEDNYVSGALASVVAGKNNTATGIKSAILAGTGNLVQGSGGAIVSGFHNIVGSGFDSTIAGGSNNEVAGNQTFIGAGRYNYVNGDYSSVVGGEHNTASGLYSSVLGGYSNESTGNKAVVVGGSSNHVHGDYSTILGGSNMQVNSDNVVAFNGSGVYKTFTTAANGAAFFSVDRFSIGETTPDDTLEVLDEDSDAIVHVAGAGSAILKLDVDSNSAFSQIYFSKVGGTEGNISYDHASTREAERLRIGVGGPDHFFFTGEGKLGIGAAHLNPTYTLDVMGDIKSDTAIAIATDSGSTLFQLDAGSSSDANIIDFGFGGAATKGSIVFAHSADAALGELKLNVDGVSGLIVRTDNVQLPAGSALKFADGSSMRSNENYSFAAYLVGNQSVPDVTPTLLGYNTIAFDLGSSFNTGTSAYTIPVTGVYDFSSTMKLGTPSAGMTSYIQIRKNGTEVLVSHCNTEGVNQETCAVNGLIDTAAGDVITVFGQHSKGISLDVYAGQSSTYFHGHLVHRHP